MRRRRFLIASSVALTAGCVRDDGTQVRADAESDDESDSASPAGDESSRSDAGADAPPVGARDPSDDGPRSGDGSDARGGGPTTER